MRLKRTILIVLLAILAAISYFQWNRGLEKRTQRSVIFVVIDTLRWDRFAGESQNSRGAVMPFLSANSDKFTFFSNAYTTAPWTIPAVGSMMTGLFPSAHDATHLKTGLSNGLTTLPEFFQATGYETAAVISHPLIGRDYNFHQGYDTFHDANAKGNTHAKSTAEDVTSAAKNLLVRLEERKPYFLFVHYFDPHFQYLRHDELNYAPDSAGRLDGSEDIWKLRDMANEVTEEEQEFVRALYDEEVTHTDTQLEHLLKPFLEQDPAESPVIFITADHGEELFERGWLGHTRTLYEELMRVPLLVRASGLPHGEVIEKPVSVVSVAPTLVELAGFPEIADEYPHDSLTIATRNPAAYDTPIYFEVDYEPLFDRGTPKIAHKFALRRGKRVVIRDGPSSSTEAYDLSADPMQTKNLWPAQKSRFADIESDLIQLRRRLLKIKRPPSAVSRSEEAVRRLRSLGYVGGN